MPFFLSFVTTAASRRLVDPDVEFDDRPAAHRDPGLIVSIMLIAAAGCGGGDPDRN